VRPIASSRAHRTIALVWRKRSPLAPALHEIGSVMRDAFPARRTIVAARADHGCVRGVGTYSRADQHGAHMPEKETIDRAHEDAREGKSASTQAGEFVREEIHHLREGKHGARSTEQAIAIGLSKARRAGVDLDAPKKGRTSKANAPRPRRISRRARRPRGRNHRRAVRAARPRL
jgi:hypothetical protein